MADKKKETSYYELILNSILEDIPEDATKVTKDIESDKTVDDKSTELKAREKIYTKLTEDFESNYEKTHNQKRNLKTAFFWIIMPLYAVIILGSMYVILKSLCMEGNNTDVVLGAVASIIASVIAIPTIIAKYLFPTGEDKDMTEMINKMQDYDKNIRSLDNNGKTGENKNSEK